MKKSINKIIAAMLLENVQVYQIVLSDVDFFAFKAELEDMLHIVNPTDHVGSRVPFLYMGIRFSPPKAQE